MPEQHLDDKVLGDFLQVFHPVPKTQDGTCPHIEWMGEDLTHCPGVGEYKCKLQKESIGDQYGISGFDYHPCNASEHKTCPVYLATQQKQ